MEPQETIKSLVRGAYDLQKLRIQNGNRIVANFRAKLGIEPGGSEEDVEAGAKKLLQRLRTEFRQMTAGIARIRPGSVTFKADGVISTFTELALVRQYEALVQAEESQFRLLADDLESYPLWTEYLKGVKGVGPAMAGVILSEFDVHKAKYPSSFWKYAGLDVAPDGAGRSKRAEHLVDREYTDKDGNTATKKSITFNPFLKTKLTGVLGPSFLRAGSEWADVYRDYKHRLENHPKHKDKTKLHRHNMSLRYAVKMFLVALHMKWRELEGLPVSEPYSEAKLGMRHGGDAVA